jgi:hypothetical protein
LVEASPPLEEHALADELEPRREQERIVLEHCFELVFGNVFGGLYFVGVLLKINIGLDEENVIDWIMVSWEDFGSGRKQMTYSRVHPTCHHWERRSECESGSGTCPEGPGVP